MEPLREATWAARAVAGASRVDEEMEMDSKGLNSNVCPLSKGLRGAGEGQAEDGQGVQVN